MRKLSVWFALFATLCLCFPLQGCGEGTIRCNLEVGDTYNAAKAFSLAALPVDLSLTVKGNAVTAEDGIIMGIKKGKATVTACYKGENKTFVFEVYDCGETMGGFGVGAPYMSGKRIAILGDSISAGVGVTARDYIDNLAAAWDWDSRNVYNFAKSGSCITYGYRSEFSTGCELVRDNRSIISGCDYAVIFYGTNDFYEKVKIGSANDTPSSAEDASTLSGAFRYVTSTLREYNPNLKLIVLTPIFRSDMARFDGLLANGRGDTMKEYVNAVKQAVSPLGAKAIDLYSLFNMKNFKAGGKYTSDGLHPNDAGHKLISDYILNHSSKTVN